MGKIVAKSFMDNLNAFFEKHEKTCLWLSLFLGAVASFLMFDCKVSLSGDDCDYIINAQAFIKHFTYPGGRGALYPIVISPFLVGGLNLILLKTLSAVFIMLSMWLTYKGLKGKLPAVVLMPCLLIVNLCPYIFFFACHTYSEPFFMFVQALFIYFFFKYFNDEAVNIKKDWSKYVVIGLCFLAMGLTRTIGYAVMGAIILYFAFQKQWKNLIYSFGAAILVFALFSLLKAVMWPDAGAPYSLTAYMSKNFYSPEQGMEDLPGYLNRLIVNSHVYLSGFMVEFMGLRSSTDDELPHLPLLTIALYILYFLCLKISWKQNKALFFVGLYSGVMNFASFVLLQIVWEQDRLIMIYYPLTLIFLAGGIYYLFKTLKSGKYAWIYLVLIVATLSGTCFHLKVKAESNFPVLQENLLGNDLYGLTPDWENFVKMCRWADKNLDKNAVIASRKPSISYIYTGRNFHGLYSIPSTSIQEVMEQVERDKDKYLYLTIGLQGKIIPRLAPYTQYLIIPTKGNSYKINGKEVQSSIIYKIDKSLYNDEFIRFLDNNNFNYTIDHDSFLKQLINDDATNYQIENPDKCLQVITDAKIKYLLLAKIRVYTNQKTDFYINTIQQYIRFIQTKYPNAFKIINTIGTDETCELVEFVGINN